MVATTRCAKVRPFKHHMDNDEYATRLPPLQTPFKAGKRLDL
jgi:hypothetical protein